MIIFCRCLIYTVCWSNESNRFILVSLILYSTFVAITILIKLFSYLFFEFKTILIHFSVSTHTRITFFYSFSILPYCFSFKSRNGFLRFSVKDCWQWKHLILFLSFFTTNPAMYIITSFLKNEISEKYEISSKFLFWDS